MSKQLQVTSPLLPDLPDLHILLQDIWQRRWITNNGYYHQRLEKELTSWLGVNYLSLFTNGTLPLITALQALNLTDGEVITTPYSFVATTHSIWWNKLTPVFVDIDEHTCNIDPKKIESAITERTIAIMPVHCYGVPCDVEAIAEIARRYNLKVIYDAAHAFGVKINGESILHYGDMSTLSFHATKVYNTVEGGALVCHDADMKYNIDNLKNFGFRDETTVVAPGINSKMDEVRAAIGLLNLKQIVPAIDRRQVIDSIYRQELANIQGIRMIEKREDVIYNYGYFPIFVDEKEYGLSRDELYNNLKAQNIYGRRYFYPLISNFEPYCHFPSAKAEQLPIATKIANQVICLPMHQELEYGDVERVIKCIKR